MGEDIGPYKLFMKSVDEDGEYKEVKTTPSKPVIIEFADGGKIPDSSNLAMIGESAELEATITLKTMRRKRFIKLLMSYGIQRNEAYRVAMEYRKKGIPFTTIAIILYVAKKRKERREITNENFAFNERSTTDVVSLHS